MLEARPESAFTDGGRLARSIAPPVSATPAQRPVRFEADAESVEAEALAQLTAIRNASLRAAAEPSRAVISTGIALGAMIVAMLVLALLVGGGA